MTATATPLATEGVDFDFVWRVGDSRPIAVRCVDPETGLLMNLVGASAAYKLNCLPTPVTLFSTAPASVAIDTVNSIITVTIGALQTNQTPGFYDHELRVLLADGTTRTVMQGTVQLVPATAPNPFNGLP